MPAAYSFSYGIFFFIFVPKIVMTYFPELMEDDGKGGDKTMATSGKAIFISAIVVICGFLVFLASNFLPNYELGVMMALNMGACLVVSMTVLPAVLNTFKPRFVYGREVATVERFA